MYSLDNKEVKDGLLEAAKILQQEDYTNYHLQKPCKVKSRTKNTST